MAILLLKLTITPVAIVGATLVARRFGPAVAGWLIGLPLTACPVALFLTLEHGSRFTAHVAKGFVAGITAEVAFVLGYVLAARRRAGWPLALTAGTASFAAAGLALDVIDLPLGALLACSVASVLLGLKLVPGGSTVAAAPPPRYDLPLRIVLATGLVLAITAFASTLGPGLSGIATTYPLLSTLVAVFVHRSSGAAGAVAVYRGLLFGLFALTGFAFTLAVVISRLPVADAFALAVGLTLSIQLGSLRVVRRPVAA